MPVRVMERDLQLVRKTNSFGAVSVAQFAEMMGGVDFSTGARRVRALVDNAGLLARRPVPLLSSVAIVATKRGCALANDALPPLGGIRLGTWMHDHTLVDVGCALEKRLQGQFEPARRIRFRLGDKATGHLPDGYIWRGEGKAPIAVELELTKKAPRRLTDILARYRADMSIAGVVYVVTDDTMARFVRRFIGDDPKFFRVALLEAVLQPPLVRQSSHTSS